MSRTVLGGIVPSSFGIVVRGGPLPRRGRCLLGLLLVGHGALGVLAGARVGLGALAVHRQVTTVAQTLVAADLDLAADVRPIRLAVGDIITEAIE